MKRIAIVAVVVSMLAIAAEASTATATVLCNSATNPCTTGTFGKETLEAQLKAGTKASFAGATCEESSIKDEITNTGGAGKTVSGVTTALNFGKCASGACTIKALKTGTFSISYSGGNNGTLHMEGLELTYACTIAGTHFECVYTGSAEGALKGGSPATLTVKEQPLSLKEGGCESSTSWSGEYTIERSLYVEEYGVSGVLCKTATNPCGSTYPLGTELQLHSTGLALIKIGASEDYCNVTIKGTVTNVGSSTRVVAGNVTQFTFFECTFLLNTIKNGTFTVSYTSSNSGTLTLENFELEFGSCRVRGPASLSLLGGESARGLAESSSMGGSLFCPTTWSVEFTVPVPNALYVEPS